MTFIASIGMPLSRRIDQLTEWIGKSVQWLILATVLISAGNAIVRKAFNIGSNAFLEIQWYLFAAVFLLCAGYTLLRNEHVRIDVLTSRLSPRGQLWGDIIGIVAFLLPFSALMVALSWPQFTQAWSSNEMSSQAGGLIRWPVLAIIPLAFGLLCLQGLSELIKRFSMLAGVIPTPPSGEHSPTGAVVVAEHDDLPYGSSASSPSNISSSGQGAPRTERHSQTGNPTS